MAVEVEVDPQVFHVVEAFLPVAEEASSHVEPMFRPACRSARRLPLRHALPMTRMVFSTPTHTNVLLPESALCEEIEGNSGNRTSRCWIASNNDASFTDPDFHVHARDKIRAESYDYLNRL